MSNTLMLHCGGKPATFEEVCDVEIPEQTATYRPVPHGDLVRLCRSRMEREFGLASPVEQFGMNKEGKQFFGTLTYDLGGDNRVDLSAFAGNGIERDAVVKAYGFSIALRNSIDKSLKAAVAGGLNTFNCDNLTIHGSSFTILLPHTKNVWESLKTQVMGRVADAASQYVRTVRFVEGMKRVSVDSSRGYEKLGLARGRGILTGSQFERAVQAWRGTMKEDDPFYDMRYTAYALYQSFTEGLKLGSVARKMDQYTGVSDFFENHDLAPSTNHMTTREEMIEEAQLAS